MRVLDVETETVTTEDVLVLGTDGLWDVVSCTISLDELEMGGFNSPKVMAKLYCDDAGE